MLILIILVFGPIGKCIVNPEAFPPVVILYMET